VPPVNVTELAVLVIVPPHWGLAGVPDTVRFGGRTSVRVTPVKGAAVWLRREMPTVATPPADIVVGEKALRTVSPACTARVSEAGAGFEIPCAVVIAPAGMVFVNVTVGAVGRVVTDTTIVQVARLGGVGLAGIVPPVS
jgi:hypothetical protein